MAQMGFGALQQGFQVVIIEAAQHEDLRTRQQCADQFEGRVFRRRADEDHRAVLDDRQKSILLRAVEAVDLVDEEQGALAHLAALPGRVEHLAQIRHAGKDRRQRLEYQIRALRQQSGDRRLAAARRAPEDHRGQFAVRDHSADRSIGGEQMVLTDDFREAVRAKQVGQRMRRLVLE